MTHRTHASARAQQLLLALLLASLAGTGCFSEDGFVTFGIYEFSAGFKPSLSPVSQNEIDALEFASDGGPDGNEIVSEVDWSTLKIGSAHVYGNCAAASVSGSPTRGDLAFPGTPSSGR